MQRMKIPCNERICNYKNFFVKNDELNREIKLVKIGENEKECIYNIFNIRQENVGTIKVPIKTTFIEKFPWGRYYTKGVESMIYKNKQTNLLVKFICVANSDSLKPLVIYKPLYGNEKYYAIVKEKFETLFEFVRKFE